MPADRKFCHLHLHTHYSMLDGFNRIPPLVERTKKLGMNACAITDHGNLFGAIEFHTECTKAGINPIIGYEAYLAPTSRTERNNKHEFGYSTHLTLLAKNATGFRNLIKLSSIAYLEGFYRNPRIDRQILEEHKEGLICLSGCLAGEFNQYIMKDKVPEAEKLAKYFRKLFGENFYIEIQNNGIAVQDECTPVAADISQKTGIPLVATADAHYLCAEDALAHDVLFCISTRRKHDPRKRLYPEERMPNPYYVRSPEDMYRLFPQYAEAVARSQTIADGVDIQLDFKKRHFPVFLPPANQTPEEFLRELCEQGVKERYGENPSEAVRKRLEHELGIINKMGFASYFLIVWDFVRFARESGIPSTARGSGCGAIVSYVLYLSHVCPLEYDLLFERFLDPNRSEAPDIDIDFCQDRRELVIDYVKRKYGVESVAQIGTFGTLAAKNAMKDVGRALDVPLDRVNFMCKLVPMKGAISADLDEAMATPDFRREYDQDPQVRTLVDIAMKLEGTNRNAGTHAAGVVIASGPITDYVPVQIIKRKDESGETRQALTTQWVMGDLEKVGMLKMDFLGLRTLSLVDATVQLIKKTRGPAEARAKLPPEDLARLEELERIDFDMNKIGMEDAETYKLLQRGDAKGVFQFESEGIRELLKRMKPDNIRDIVACTALYRPGPLEGGMVDEYIDCKHGRKKPVYPHAIMEEVLSETYGVMVYQEQVMRCLNRLGGLELSSAYACIKAISKKKEDIINARRIDFVKGAKDRGLDGEKAEEIFELIVKFGGYGFNKSHSAAYAHVSYHTGYLKRHFTAEFFAALLSSEIDDGNKRDMLVDHIADARKFGVHVQHPDVNLGEGDFTVRDGQVVFGLVAIKGLGRGAAAEIVRAREEKGPFTDLYDFCERIDTKTVTKAAIERLIKAGAMDAFAEPFAHRAQLLAALPGAIQAAEGQQEDRRRGQRSIFDLMDGDGESTNGTGVKEKTPLPNVPRWTNTEQLKNEKEALDFYFSSHPLAEFDAALKRYSSHTCEMVNGARSDSEVRFGGMLSSVRFMTTKKGDRFVRCKVEDFTGQCECVMWPSDFQRYPDKFADDKIYLFEARVEDDQRGNGKVIILTRLMTLDEARAELTKGMILHMALGQHGPDTVDRLGAALKRKKGPCVVYLQVKDQGGRRAQFRLGDDFKVNAAEVPLEELEMLLGAGAVTFTGR
ncbi:MAG TPA: DNA polymerase III subunit alpha [Gemmataceae bacterium]|nr:DNA polymerase III subunit alpha [Gemmataceae bacterium]